MGKYDLLLLLSFVWTFVFAEAYQLQVSQAQVLLQLRKHLEYPKQLESWTDHRVDFCTLSFLPLVNVTCQGSVVTELRIAGDTKGKVDEFIGFAIPNRTLSESFSLDSFITTLTRLNSLRVLSLVSLGIWGPLPDKIHRLSSLEYLDLSSNYLFGSIPPKISTMMKLQTLKLDDNFFNDTVPDWFDSLSSLTVLSLKNNKIKDSFPSSILSISTLTELVMSGNYISGELPDLSPLHGLTVLDLSWNKIDSPLPLLPKTMIMVLLGKNSFSGEIPQQYGQLSQQQQLDISFNALTGIPPATIFSLPNISHLNLSSNKLSGSLPINLRCGNMIQFVDISNNMLTGGLPSCLGIESDKRTLKVDGNCLSVNVGKQHTKSYCDTNHMHQHQEQSRAKNAGVLMGLLLGILLSVLLLSIGVVLCRRCWPREISEQHLLQKSVQDSSAAGFASELLTSARFVSQAAKLGIQGLPLCRTFSLEEIKEATRNFHDATIIGDGSYGKLYRGRLENGTQVAIRSLLISKKFSIRNLKLRLDMLGKLRHSNLVCLLGHCIDGDGQDFSDIKVFLVSEHVPNGSFRTHLSEKVLNWSERLAILISIAKAVHFLHTGVIPGFFDNQLKINNILIDEHNVAKLSDYGLSIISEEPAKSVAKGEGPQAWQMMNLKDDVYSFGFILLEALVAPSVSTRKGPYILKEMMSLNSQDGRRGLIDPTILATCSQESLSTIISLMNKCISPEMSRPSMEDVLWNLQYANQVQDTRDGDQRYSSASQQ
ncbi:probable inactive leucine-rich repeat receptor-like protein kinase At3g03770 [Cucurbita pepo subsp. pepo]|uniref:probable inactive leucine-rich repeat receptor-like protein kinase At3g03770 n=1 Tax=Cucurbita pepo subsp. pepo TaxID=3664 RepID=UPI000C9D3618|nr:probable inactive leucine-rich repeat receptor-like protein kinase At3g03770 [Cucurbita pepo subsp. pepo]